MKPLTRTITVYRTAGLTSAWLRDALNAEEFTQLCQLDAESDGFVQIDGAPLRHMPGNFLLFKHRAAARVLPSSVVKQTVAETVAAIEKTEGRRVGRKEMAEIKESVILELRPRAFIKTAETWAWLDENTGLLYVGANVKRADAIFDCLFRGLNSTKESEDFKLLPFRTEAPTAHRFDAWLIEGAPTPFCVDDSARLATADAGKVTINNYATAIEQAAELLGSGATCQEIALTWSDRLGFSITDTLVMKHIALLDTLAEQADAAENEQEQFDADFFLLAKHVALAYADLEKVLT